MSEINIPPEALEKGHAEWFRLIKAGATTDVALAAAFRAIVEGWPGMDIIEGVYCGKPYRDMSLPLLPPEASDD